MNHPFFPAPVAAAPRRALRRASQLLPLEQRFMFDGAVADAAHAAQAHDSAPPPAPPAVTVRAADPAKDDGKKEVALVDTSVANYKSLEAGVRDGVGIVEFDGSRDGLAQIAQWAAGQSGIDAIHILSHGAEGVLDLGSTHLTAASLASSTTQAELAQLGRALTTDGDLLLYGCDVAGGDGAHLLAGLATATGADVAASTDLTGAASRGGNWMLEAHAGKIDTDALALTGYDGLLSTLFIHFTDFPDGTNEFTEVVDGVTLLFSSDSFSVVPSGTDGLTDSLYGYDSSTSAGIRITISAPTAYSFDWSSVQLYAEGVLTFSAQYANGSSGSFHHTGINAGETLSLGTAGNGITSITISSPAYADFQSFALTMHSLLPTNTVLTAALSSDTAPNGATNSDFITKTAPQTITGTLASNLAAGDRVEVSYDGGNNWSDATSFTVGQSTWSTTTTLSGSNTFLAHVYNSYGSTTAYSHSYTLDTTAPTTSFSGISLSADTGASGSDLITKTASQTITATLSGAPTGTDIVEGSVDGGVTWTNVTSKVSGTTLSWDTATLVSGNNALAFRVTDLAGNIGPVTSKAYTLDTNAPTTMAATAKFSHDTGSSSVDFKTNDPAQTITGTLGANLASGETVYVSINNGATWTAASATVGDINWSLAVTLTSTSIMRIKVSDQAGNDAPQYIQGYTYDNTPPTTTFSGLAFSADTGVAGDFITKTAAQTITATLSVARTAGDILYGSLDGGTTWTDIGAKVSGTTLTWTGVTLTGSNTLQLKMVDEVGNASTIRSQAYTLDTTAPATPATPTLDTDTGVSASDHITKDNTPTLSGTAEDGSTVTIYDGATPLGTTVATGGTWSYTTGTMSDTSHSYSVTATDIAGNVSAASAGLTVTIDSSAPTVGSVAVPANGTYYTGDPLSFTVNFNETVLVDSSGGVPRLAITIGATTRYATYVSGSGSSALVFSYSVVNGDIDSNGITLGALSVNGGTLRDTAGNDATLTLNSVGSTANIDVDGTDPSITNISASNLNGAYGAGATITITLDFSTAVTVDVTGGTPTLALDGGGNATYSGGSGTSTLSFSYTVGTGQNSADLDVASTSALSLNGATIIDAGGAHRNASVVLGTPGTAGSLGANKAIVIDTTAPTATIASAGLSADTGTPGDFITRTAAQTILGTLSSGLAAGESVLVSLDNGGTWHTAAVSGGVNWSLSGQTLSGSGTLKVKVTDAAGNDGTPYAHTYSLDTTAPTTTIGSLGLSADNGISHTDFLTNQSAQTITATLSSALAAGEVVYGSLDNGASWTDITSKVSGTTLSWNGVTLLSSDTLKLKITDGAGNDGAIASHAYVLDTSGPTNSVASVGFSADSGAPGDFITNIAAQDISGTLASNLGADETVLVSLDNGASWHAASASVGSNTWSLAGQTLSASDTLQVKVSDNAGNDGAVLSQAYVYATSATVPTVDVLSTMSTTPLLTGHAALAAGETMTVSVGGATYDVTPVAGAWSLDLASAVPVSGALTLTLNQRYSVTATVTDLAGNTSNDASANELTVGTIAPPPPPVVLPTTTASGASLSNDSGASASDFITNVAQQTISGSLSAPLATGESVAVSLDGGASWAAASVSDTSWSYSGTLSGSNTLLVRVSGPGGDGPLYSHGYTVDATAPDAPAVAALSSSSLTPVLSGSATLADGETLSVSVGGADYAVSVSGGKWSLDLASAAPSGGSLALAAGNRYDVVATVTDLAGNKTSGGSALTIAALPVVTGLTLSADSGAASNDFVTNVAAQTLSGTLSAPLSAGQTVEVSVDGGTTWSTASVSASSWSASVTLSASNTLVARVSSGGKNSTPFQHAYVLDTTAPLAAPTLTTVANDGNVSGSLSAPLGAGETLVASRDGGATWTSVANDGQSWSLPSNGASSVQVRVGDTAGNFGGTLAVNTTVTTEPPLPPALPEAPTPVTPGVPTTPSAPGTPPLLVSAPTTPGSSGIAGPNGPGGTEPGAPLVLPLAGAGGDIALTWPGQTPPGVIDTLPASVALTPAPDFDASQPAPANAALLQTAPDSSFQIITLPDLPGGDALVAYTPIADVNSASGEALSVQVGSDAFAQSGSNANVELSAQSADGSPLPGWIKFDGKTARFEGTPPLSFEGTLTFKVVARDSQGRLATQVFKIVVSKDGKGEKSSEWHRTPADPVGRASLGEQMRSARSAGAARLAALSA